MSAEIVYDGTGSGGALFEGKKFWLAQRVPQRPRWLAAIQNNGGQVTLLEKNADILIADHAHKGAPPGSYSWTYIQDSLKFGELQALSDHPAGPSTGVVRQVGSVRPTKSTRTPFTAADDRFLLGWVLHAEQKGISLSGNQLYQDLERANTRHTWQSWRDRYVKSLRHKPRPTEGDLVELPGEVIPASTGPRSSGMQKQESLRRSDQYIHSRAARRADSSTSEDQKAKLSSIGKCSFTVDDVALLETEYDAIQSMDADKSVAAWQYWAETYPQHTASEWQWIWTRKVRNFLDRERGRRLEEPDRCQSYLKPRRYHDVASKQTPSGNIVYNNKMQPQDLNTTNKSVLIPRTDDKDEVESGDHHVANKTRSLLVTVDDDEVELEGRKAQLQGQSSDDAVLLSNESSSPLATSTKVVVEMGEKEFLLAYAGFINVGRVEARLSHMVCGRSLDLFRLRELVNSEKFGGFDAFTSVSHWSKLATELNFSSFKYPQAAKELKTLYQETLLDFDDCYTRFALNGTNSLASDFRERHSAGDESVTFPLNTVLSSQSLKRPALSIGNPLAVGRQSSPENKRPRCAETELEIPSTPEPPEPCIVRHSPSDDQTLQPSRATRQSETPLHGKVTRPHARSVDSTESSAQNRDKVKQSSAIISIDTDVGLLKPEVDDENALDASSTGDQQNEVVLESWIDAHIRLNYPEDIVIQALQATTMETGDAFLVMESLMADKGIPKNIQGVWTAEDDDLIRKGVTDPTYRTVTRKHGYRKCQKRKEFLRLADAIMESDTV